MLTFLKEVEKKKDIAIQYLYFERYGVLSLKEATWTRRRGDISCCTYDVKYSTYLKVPLKLFLANSDSKDKLTVFIAVQCIDTIRNRSIVVSTKIGAKSNGIDVSWLNINQEEADTLLIPHALYVCQRAEKITIITPDTDVFIVALQKYLLLGPKCFHQLGTGCKGREANLDPIYHKLNSVMVEGLIGLHALTGADTTLIG